MLDYIDRLYADGKEYVTRKQACDAFEMEVICSGLVVVDKNLKVVID